MSSAFFPESVARRSVRLAALVLVVGSGTAWAANPAKVFPEFPAKKAGLQEVALVADVVVVEDVIGRTEKVYLEDCKRLGERVIETFSTAMAEKGYRIDRKPLLSVGQLVDESLDYRILSTWEQHKLDAEQFPVARPPFYVDTTLCPGDTARAAWRAVLRSALAYERKKGKPAATIPEVVQLQPLLGKDHVFVLLVLGTKVPFGKQFGQSMLSGGKSEVASFGNVSVTAGVNFTQYSGTTLKLAMLDCRSGDVLWSDDDYVRQSINEDRVEKMSRDLIKHLP